MTQKMLTSAVFAGVIAGLCAAALQFVFVIPALLESELFESGARLHFGADGVPESPRGSPGLGAEWGRHAMTVAFNIVTYVGYGLLLAAAMMFAATKDIQPSAKQGLIWGICGYIAVQLAPAMGLPPELPGVPAADVVPRQIWWISTIIATAVGLALIAFGRGFMPLLGAVAILVPQLIGAPHLDVFLGVAPPELAAEFSALSLGTAAAGWAILGYGVGHFLADS